MTARDVSPTPKPSRARKALLPFTSAWKLQRAAEKAEKAEKKAKKAGKERERARMAKAHRDACRFMKDGEPLMAALVIKCAEGPSRGFDMMAAARIGDEWGAED
ncbi:hypothetical protein MKZ38_000250 [Zalerion maritima]|uniref:Uncharacterized protein n=1 Tax=Zalerion maritima TaxID=339359 RepID=A0AAD5WSM9_9PEZI|nr:hypothetical protein MKZ38_000250 [Zalerion maritima]